jgi:hypothetical protein
MKRKIEGELPDYHAAHGNPKLDFTSAQLAGIGAIAMNYNEAENLVEAAFSHATQLHDGLRLDVSTRINGIDGKIEIINKAAEVFGLDEDICKDITISLGEAGFKLIKNYRDAVIHARPLNAPTGIGVRVDRRARIYEVLLTEEALDTPYDHIGMLRAELFEINQLILSAVESQACRNEPEKGQFAALISIAKVQLRKHRNLRLSLRQLPKFPSESELTKARDIWHQAQLRVQHEILAAFLEKHPLKDLILEKDPIKG